MSNYELILDVFFKKPLEEFGLRELSRITKVSPLSLKNYLKQMQESDLIKIRFHKSTKHPIYLANYNSEDFKLRKKLRTILLMNDMGLIKELNDLISPRTIILFGSASRGEDNEHSDIDLFIQSEQKEIKLKNYEIKLNRKINLFFQKSFEKLSDELKNNILNGIIVSGYFKVY